MPPESNRSGRNTRSTGPALILRDGTKARDLVARSAELRTVRINANEVELRDSVVINDNASGSAIEAFANGVDILKPSTTYRYRLRAANPAGTTLGAEASFTTAKPGTPDPGGSGPQPGQPGRALLSLTKVSVKPARFRVGRRRTAMSARRRPVPWHDTAVHA